MWLWLGNEEEEQESAAQEWKSDLEENSKKVNSSVTDDLINLNNGIIVLRLHASLDVGGGGMVCSATSLAAV